MNDDLQTLVRELETSRVALRVNTRALKEEANPVHRFQRSWHDHRWAWIGAGAGAAGLLALLLFRRKPAPPPVPRGYVVVAPAPKQGWFFPLLKFALVAAKPLATAIMKKAATRNGTSH